MIWVPHFEFFLVILIVWILSKRVVIGSMWLSWAARRLRYPALNSPFLPFRWRPPKVPAIKKRRAYSACDDKICAFPA